MATTRPQLYVRGNTRHLCRHCYADSVVEYRLQLPAGYTQHVGYACGRDRCNLHVLESLDGAGVDMSALLDEAVRHKISAMAWAVQS